MSDLISRQAAYETLSEYYHHRTEIQHKGLREALDRVPSAEPVRMKGKWLDYTCMNWHGWHCSECDYETQKKTRYCPNCGAFMSEGDE